MEKTQNGQEARLKHTFKKNYFVTTAYCYKFAKSKYFAMTRKHQSWILITLMCFATQVGSAQNNKGIFTEKFNKLVKKTKKEMEKAGHILGDAIGFEDRVNYQDDDDRLIDGTYYMPLHTTNGYQDKEAVVMRDTCRQLFAARYPKAKILHVVIPQKNWLITAVENDNKTNKGEPNIVAYNREMFVYVLAKDGNDGYIHARMRFVWTKKVGEEYRKREGLYPLWERTDVLTPQVYEELQRKQAAKP